MEQRKNLRTLTLVVVAAALGYLAVPPVASAAGDQMVKIVSGTGTSQAKVSGGKLKVDTEAATDASGRLMVDTEGSTDTTGRLLTDTEAVTVPGALLTTGQTLVTSVDLGIVLAIPFGNDLIAQGTTSNASACSAAGVVSGIAVDGSSGGTVSVTGGGASLWTGTVAAGGHLNDTFDGGLFYANPPLAVTVTGGGPHWYLYGACFAGAAASRLAKAVMRAHAR